MKLARFFSGACLIALVCLLLRDRPLIQIGPEKWSTQISPAQTKSTSNAAAVVKNGDYANGVNDALDLLPLVHLEATINGSNWNRLDELTVVRDRLLKKKW